MIGWLFDRYWLWKNRAQLDELDAQADFLSAQSERLNKRMEEAFGTDWRQEANERLKRATSCTFTEV